MNNLYKKIQERKLNYYYLGMTYTIHWELCVRKLLEKLKFFEKFESSSDKRSNAFEENLVKSSYFNSKNLRLLVVILEHTVYNFKTAKIFSL